MKQLPGIVVAGASGRMGQLITQMVAESKEIRLIGVLEHKEHDWVGKELNTCIGGLETGLKVSDDPVEAFCNAQAIIDFTVPDVSVEFAQLAAQARLVHVIGTTGFNVQHLEEIKLAALHAVIVRAGNMSLGVNLLVQLAKKVATVLGDEYDAEVVEMHHNKKIDTPSGTALMLGQAVAEGRGVNLSEVSDSGRDGITGARTRGHIGFSAIRGGDVIGEHDVIFAGLGERVVLRHLANDRSLYARGAIRAALWGQGKRPGEYNMMDVLGL
ncbi:MAG: 4-hydroxy-tetrahydrodipicolinate reductase [Aestuariivita sp.]|nr:4-hydroxy-tetrahydrodipicolinate reductase [Aestuariivita sp.]